MLIIVAVTLFGGWFYKSYGNEKHAAELARQVEKREYEEWKANQELEIENERTRLENDFSTRQKLIENNAIENYKKSNAFIIDGATYIANNFFEYRLLETFYQEMPIKDKKRLGLYDYLNQCHKEWKKEYGNKTPRDLGKN